MGGHPVTRLHTLTEGSATTPDTPRPPSQPFPGNQPTALRPRPIRTVMHLIVGAHVFQLWLALT